MTTLACAIISSAPRWPLVRDHILPVVRKEHFEEIVLVGDGLPGHGYRYLAVPSITGTTIDALIKRDTAAVATESEYLCYFSDDHSPVPGFVAALRDYVSSHSVEVLIPHRMTMRTIDGTPRRIDLNSGAAEGYCGGHAGVFHRDIVRGYPWTTAPHDRLWDLLHSQQLRAKGVIFHVSPHITVEDIEHFINPSSTPWL